VWPLRKASHFKALFIFLRHVNSLRYDTAVHECSQSMFNLNIASFDNYIKLATSRAAKLQSFELAKLGSVKIGNFCQNWHTYRPIYNQQSKMLHHIYSYVWLLCFTNTTSAKCVYNIQLSVCIQG